MTLADAIAETLQSLQPRAVDAAVEIRVALDPCVVGVVVGPLVAVLHDGLQNAIDACAATIGGPRRIELLAQRRGSELVVDVLDSGRGLGAGPRTNPRSHGIGLNLSRLIVEELGGSLELSSVPLSLRRRARDPRAAWRD